jgi:2',3'-cyclic-nucleotide 2'-phosphodiesterase (5'-nucleotidase family)
VAARLVPQLRAESDVVIVLSHLGVDEDRALAARVPGIDLIVGGHSHTFLPHPVIVRNGGANGYHGTAIVQAGTRGSRIGRVSLRIAREGITRVEGVLLPVRPEEGEDPDVAAMLRPFVDSITVSLEERVTTTRARVPTAGMRDGETPLGDFAADALREAAGADIGILNSGGIRAPLPEGAVTVGDLYATFPFDDGIVTVEMPGWRLRGILDFVARRIGTGGFAQVSGVQFTIGGDRASHIRVGGEVLDGNRVYRVATVDFLYQGGDGYTQFAKAGPARDSGVTLRDAAIAFLRRHPDYEFRKRDRMHWEGRFPGRSLPMR